MLYPILYLTIIRQRNSDKGCNGILLVDCDPFCFTLERPVHSNRRRIDAIPAGSYPVELHPYASKPSWGLLPLVLDVPGRDGIFFHRGNTIKDSMGCILLGMTEGQGVVYDSVVAIDALVTLLKDKFITLDIVDRFK